MMKTADLRNRNDPIPIVERLLRPRCRAILIEGVVGPTMIIVVDVFIQKASQMTFAHDNYMVEAFAPDCPDRPLDVHVLPGRLLGCDVFPNT